MRERDLTHRQDAPRLTIPKKAARKLKASLEKTTLGDITGLQALKDEMEEKEAKSLGKKKK